MSVDTQTKEADKMKFEHIESMVSVKYEGRVAYVPEDKLLPMSDQHIDYDSEEPALRAGYAQVQVDGEVYIVKAEDIYTKVVPYAGIAGGLAVPTPGGGWTALAGKPTHEDSEGNLYVRNYW
jgi:hypothetical protein